MHTFFIAPTGFGVGLTSISLGLLRALERAGLKVGFFKPIAQLHPGDLGPERSSELVARTHGLDTPKPLPLYSESGPSCSSCSASARSNGSLPISIKVAKAQAHSARISGRVRATGQ